MVIQHPIVVTQRPIVVIQRPLMVIQLPLMVSPSNHLLAINHVLPNQSFDRLRMSGRLAHYNRTVEWPSGVRNWTTKKANPSMKGRAFLLADNR